MNELNEYEQKLIELIQSVRDFNSNALFEEFIVDPNETPQEAIQRYERQFEQMNQTFRK